MCACVGAGVIWEISVPFPQFCCKPKTALMNKILIKKIKKKGRKEGRRKERKKERKLALSNIKT